MGSGSSSTRNTESPNTTSSEPIKTQHHVRQASIRAKQPMPDPNELERRFTKVLVCQKRKKRIFQSVIIDFFLFIYVTNLIKKMNEKVVIINFQLL